MPNTKWEPDKANGKLGKQLIMQAAQQQTGEVDVNNAAMSVGSTKRRIYDACAVITGLGIFEKTTQSRYGWARGDIDSLIQFNEQIMYNDGQFGRSDPEFF